MKLENLRKDIDETDWQLLELMKKRLNISVKIARIKKEMGLPIYDKKREQIVLADRQKKGENLGLGKEFINKIWRLLFEQSKGIQRSQRT